ncbi:hypothetical protein E2C01_036569 [Portunus trituberculatus]|uniref:Uncharacterized protein n=1 Tax=Portunus trituberculatus TaxID=210409 RepID=A0A5B7FBQ7_PORTR|nr:hypothetical protein [Portunus trituberculatus]
MHGLELRLVRRRVATELMSCRCVPVQVRAYARLSPVISAEGTRRGSVPGPYKPFMTIMDLNLSSRFFLHLEVNQESTERRLHD